MPPTASSTACTTSACAAARRRSSPATARHSPSRWPPHGRCCRSDSRREPPLPRAGEGWGEGAALADPWPHITRPALTPTLSRKRERETSPAAPRLTHINAPPASEANHRPMLSATDLACSRGERPLFSGLNFALQAGDWLHVKGENGAGKTTLLRTLVGLSPADHGEVRWDGTPTRAMADDYRRNFVYLGHQAALKDELSALENLRLALAVDGINIDLASLADALRCLGLQGREALPARHLSAGQKRR